MHYVLGNRIMTDYDKELSVPIYDVFQTQSGEILSFTAEDGSEYMEVCSCSNKCSTEIIAHPAASLHGRRGGQRTRRACHPEGSTWLQNANEDVP